MLILLIVTIYRMYIVLAWNNVHVVLYIVLGVFTNLLVNLSTVFTYFVQLIC
jgi:hypothetical protein